MPYLERVSSNSYPARRLLKIGCHDPDMPRIRPFDENSRPAASRELAAADAATGGRMTNMK